MARAQMLVRLAADPSKVETLAYNLKAMAEWCAANGFWIAPHGKTTMTPGIFERQLQAGAWGMTVATASQALICARMGISRILIANQVVGRANMRSLAAVAKANLGARFAVDEPGHDHLAQKWGQLFQRPIDVDGEQGLLVPPKRL